MVNRGLAVAVAALAALALSTAPASAAPTWLGAQTLSANGNDYQEPHVAVNAEGDVAVVWQRNGSPTVIQASVRPAGGTFSSPQDISDTSFYASKPRIAIDARGDVLVGFIQSNGTTSVATASFRPAGGSFGARQPLSNSSQNAFHDDIAMDPAGDAVMVWEWGGTPNYIQASYMTSGGSFGAAKDVSGAGTEAIDPRVAMDSHGNATAVYVRKDSGFNRATAATLAAGGAGSWSASGPLSGSGTNADNAHVAMDPQGDTVAVWRWFDGSHELAQESFRPAGGSFGSAQTMSSTAHEGSDVHVASDGAGNFTSSWLFYDGTNYAIQTRTISPSGALGAEQDATSGTAILADPWIAVGPQGDAIVTWTRAGATPVAEASNRAAGGSFGPTHDLSNTAKQAADVQAGVDGQGNGFAAWREQTDGTNFSIQAASFVAELKPAGGGTGQNPGGPGSTTPGATIAQLVASSVHAVTNAVTTTLACTVAPCTGKAVLTAVEIVQKPGNKVVGVRAAKKKRKVRKKVTVGSKSFSIPAGKTAKITVPLNSTGRKLLKKFGKLPVRLTVALNQPNGKPLTVTSTRVTVKAKKKRKKRHH